MQETLTTTGIRASKPRNSLRTELIPCEKAYDLVLNNGTITKSQLQYLIQSKNNNAFIQAFSRYCLKFQNPTSKYLSNDLTPDEFVRQLNSDFIDAMKKDTSLIGSFTDAYRSLSQNTRNENDKAILLANLPKAILEIVQSNTTLTTNTVYKKLIILLKMVNPSGPKKPGPKPKATEISRENGSSMAAPPLKTLSNTSQQASIIDQCIKEHFKSTPEKQITDQTLMIILTENKLKADQQIADTTLQNYIPTKKQPNLNLDLMEILADYEEKMGLNKQQQKQAEDKLINSLIRNSADTLTVRAFKNFLRGL